MNKPAAKLGDKVMGVDTHIVMVPSPMGPMPTPTLMPFTGILIEGLCDRVKIENDSAATVGSKAQNMPPHLPAGGPFLRPPKNQATIQRGSERVIIGNKAAARSGDPAITCNDPADAPNGVVAATGRVLIG